MFTSVSNILGNIRQAKNASSSLSNFAGNFLFSLTVLRNDWLEEMNNLTALSRHIVYESVARDVCFRLNSDVLSMQPTRRSVRISVTTYFLLPQPIKEMRNGLLITG